jgi:hypothetical protein
MEATGGVKRMLQLEGFALLALSAGLYAHLVGDWRLFAILILAPDVAFVFYLFGPRVGAIGYNAVHSTIGPIALAAAGIALNVHLALAVALIWLAHIGFDRALGFGLKYASAFSDTHLGHRFRAQQA